RTVRNEGLALTPSQEHGRQLFGITCGQCHKLAAAHTAGRIGPDLDKLKPNTPLVLDAIQRGRARGIGRMPAGLYRGKDAQDIASFVNRTAGRQ
ncbi:MAG TPA: c-type cytochrome, partial [Solirubrobacteraceae bacterium]|nr:c-type cytochrome [Solirubrobacteraceae bacterium]